MPVARWPSFSPGLLWRKFEVCPLEREHRAKAVTGWLGAACVLATICLCLLPARGLAQDSAASAAATAKTNSAKPATAKKPVKTSSSASKSSSSSTAKSHTASHSTAAQDTRSKNTNAAARPHGKVKYASSRKNGKKRPRGQQKIDSERAQAIQEALIREHYMTGEPAGTWNQASEDAMRRYQADHGWQSKEVPDSRALISLGLGPSNDHLLNPESAMTTAPSISHSPAPVSSPSQSPVSHGADPGPRMSPSSAPSSDSLPVTRPDHDAPSPQ
jgi:hypothetical protein